ncbi:hypothetical protein GCM10011579_067220 [Streptomyces albiflavescens]|uniref:Lipoprotein n=1 Tax=Streptomyces albiflavescens TaxID=1623582 RepID=A0A917YBQ1_9ACTN|nr:hypothetical protein [Streptomyces albiflavescens]GGN81049.1 hypothetical protein GCM10011579_067220 [Streptomyces albiflavescens]
MTHRSLAQRLLMLAAPTALAAGGVLLPTSALAAPMTPHFGTVTTQVGGVSGHHHHGTATPGVKWVETTDAPSGITFKLPGKPKMQEIPQKEAGDYPARVYAVPTSDGFMYFLVIDVRGAGPAELKDAVEGTRQGMADDWGGAAVTSQKHNTVDGRPALDARFSSTKGDHMVATSLAVADDDHIVQAVTVGPEAKEKSVTEAQEQAAAGLRIP